MRAHTRVCVHIHVFPQRLIVRRVDLVQLSAAHVGKPKALALVMDLLPRHDIILFPVRLVQDELAPVFLGFRV